MAAKLGRTFGRRAPGTRSAGAGGVYIATPRRFGKRPAAERMQTLTQLFAASPLDTLLANGAATPEALQLLATHQGATLTRLDWGDRIGPHGWGAAGPHLAGLTALRELSVCVRTRTLPAGLLAGIQQLRGLRELSLWCYARESEEPEGEGGQEQQPAEGFSLDLGFLAASAATLQTLLLDLDTPPANTSNHSPPEVTLPAALARRLTALQTVTISARGWGMVKGLDSLPAIRNVILMRLESEGAQLWSSKLMHQLRIDKATLGGPSGNDFTAACQLESLCCRDCTLPKRGFPESLCRLPLLTELELVNCKLDEHNLMEPLPCQLTELPMLVYLNLEGNGLDQVPAIVPQLSRLLRLNLNCNRLSELPANMTSMRSLSMLELVANQLAEYPSVLYDMYYIALLDLSNNPLRPTDLDSQRLAGEQCFWQSDTDACWLFMGEDSCFGEGDANHWTSDDMNAAVAFTKMLPRCELRLGGSQRASIIADEWREHLFVWRLRMPDLWAPCPWDQLCRRWRHVYSHSPLVWQAAWSSDPCVKTYVLAARLFLVPHESGDAQQQGALQTWLGITRRRAPAVRALSLTTGFMVRPPPLQLPSLVDLLELFAASRLETLRGRSAATPEALQLLAAHQVATLTSLDWGDALTPSDWAAAGPCLAGLTSLRNLSISFGTRTPPAGLLAGVKQLRGLTQLSLTYRRKMEYGDLYGRNEQEQQHAEGFSLDLGFLAGSAATLGSFHLALDTPPVNSPGHPPPAVTLPEELASQLTALTHVAFRAPGWSTGPASAGFDALGCQLKFLCCSDCTIPKRGFPESLCRLPLLIQLDLVKCKLDGLIEPLPGQLTELPLLVYLNLAGNALDQVPTFVPQLSRLLRLNLTDNRLSGLPASLTSIRCLAMLELAGNQLAEYPSVLYDMYHIAVLDVSNNPLRPTDLDSQRLADEQCFWQSPAGMWLFMGKDPGFGTVRELFAARQATQQVRVLQAYAPEF
ncbi:hypothetical protein N2152v2_002970 [Parachlorella kessleri]